MARFLKKRPNKGLPPGSLVPRKPKGKKEAKISVINFNSEEFSERNVSVVDECVDEAMSSQTITWINIEGLTDTKVIEDIGKKFGVSRLWLEDILNTDHRPKIDEIDDLVFIILKTVHDYDKRRRVFFEQISLFLGENFVLSFQEYPGDVFESVKTRLMKKQGKIRSSSADYLFYVLIDSIVDDYLEALEKVGRKIEGVEGYIAKKVDPKTPQYIVRLKQEILYLAKSALPIKEAISQLMKTTAKEINPSTKEYFKDALDHSIQIVDTIESYKQILNSLNDFYQSRVSQKMNEIMKVLTIFSAIFIPLTFVAGVYGMNFQKMPGLHSENGFLYVLGAMLAMAIFMLGFFRYRKWL